jgi:hypothetical protein
MRTMKHWLALGILTSLVAAPGLAMAARQRIASASLVSTAPPSTPEPAGALAFGVGLGVVVWAARRKSR